MEGWANGEARGGRAEEREREVRGFAAITGYHRDFETRVIDPPRAAITWRMGGMHGENVINLTGATVFEFDDESRIRRFWLFFNGPLG